MYAYQTYMGIIAFLRKNWEYTQIAKNKASGIIVVPKTITETGVERMTPDQWKIWLHIAYAPLAACIPVVKDWLEAVAPINTR